MDEVVQNDAELVEQSDLKRSCLRDSVRVSEREYERMFKWTVTQTRVDTLSEWDRYDGKKIPASLQ